MKKPIIRSPRSTCRERRAGGGIVLAQPEVDGAGAEHALLERIRRVERPVLGDALEQVQPAGADLVAVEQTGDEQVAVLREPRAQHRRVPGRRGAQLAEGWVPAAAPERPARSGVPCSASPSRYPPRAPTP